MIPVDDERQCGPGSFDDVLGLLLLHPTDVMVVNGDEHISALQGTVRRTPAKHLHTVVRYSDLINVTDDVTMGGVYDGEAASPTDPIVT